MLCRAQCIGWWMRLSLAASCALVGCERAAPQQAGVAVKGSARVGGAVVSTVNGDPITLDEVAATAKLLGIAPAAALTKLQSERLLMLEAQRAGYAENGEVQRVGKQANVQALLEAEAGSVVVSESELASEYAKQSIRFHVPEKRASTHVLVKVAATASVEDVARAKEIALQARAAFVQRPEVQSWHKRFRKATMAGIHVISEQLPAVPRDSAFEATYLEALFAHPTTSIASDPVRSSFGWHVIVMTALTPAVDVPFETARVTLESELKESKQRAQIEEIIAKKRASTSIVEMSTANAALESVKIE